MPNNRMLIRRRRKTSGLVEVHSGGAVHISVSISQKVKGKSKTFVAPREAVAAKNRYGGPFTFLHTDSSNGKQEACLKLPDSSVIKVPLIYLYLQL